LFTVFSCNAADENTILSNGAGVGNISNIAAVAYRGVVSIADNAA
jgi:hypothetical protein